MKTLSECVRCASGTYAANSGSTKCKACSAGTFQDGSGQRECKLCKKTCPAYTYQEVECIRTADASCSDSPTLVNQACDTATPQGKGTAFTSVGKLIRVVFGRVGTMLSSARVEFLEKSTHDSLVIDASLQHNIRVASAHHGAVALTGRGTAEQYQHALHHITYLYRAANLPSTNLTKRLKLTVCHRDGPECSKNLTGCCVSSHSPHMCVRIASNARPVISVGAVVRKIYLPQRGGATTYIVPEAKIMDANHENLQKLVVHLQSNTNDFFLRSGNQVSKHSCAICR